MPGLAKGLIGTVVSNKMSKTVVVLVETTTRHRLYHKILRRSKRYQAHDDRLEAKPGDRVRILATRPLSRHKRWRVSAAFFVTGLSGKMRIHTLPPRRISCVMARRAASIWRAVTHALVVA